MYRGNHRQPLLNSSRRGVPYLSFKTFLICLISLAVLIAIVKPGIFAGSGQVFIQPVTPEPGKLFSHDPPSNVIAIQGTPSQYIKLDDVKPTEINKQPNDVEELYLKHVILNPATLNKMLKVFPNLRVVNMERVKVADGVAWEFDRLILPKLQQFYMDLDIGFRDQYSDYIKEITEEGLLKLMFYDKTNSNNYTSLAQKLANDDNDVCLKYDGWTVLSWQKRKDNEKLYEAVLAITFADSLLKDFSENNVTIVHLTITECEISVSNVPPMLTYLNAYNVNFLDGNMQPLSNYSFLQKLKLVELYLEFKNSTVKLSDLPPTIKTLAVGNMRNTYASEKDQVPVSELGMSFPMDPKVVENFKSIFQNLDKVGFFEPTPGLQHELLSQVLQTKSKWVLFDGFQRIYLGNGNSSEIELRMENFLAQVGVGTITRDFILHRQNENAPWKATELSMYDKLKYRYKILGWNEFISWDVFAPYFLNVAKKLNDVDNKDEIV